MKWAWSRVWDGLALLPIAIIIVLTAAFWALGIRSAVMEPLALLIFNTIFQGLILLTGAGMCGWGSVSTGSWRITLIGAGILAIGLAGPIAGWTAFFVGPNPAITIYNISVLLASPFFLVAGVFLVRQESPHVRMNRGLVLASVYGAEAAIVVLVTILSSQNLLPAFFIVGSGPTTVRQLVLGAAAVILSASTVLFIAAQIRTPKRFSYWFALGLGIMSIGLFASMLTETFGDAINTLGRLSQYISGIYFLVAAVILGVEARVEHNKMSELVDTFSRKIEANYQLLIETINDAIACLDSQGRVLVWNTEAERMFGYSKAEARGMYLEELVLRPRDAGLFGNRIKAFALDGGREMKEGIPELIVRRKGGKEFPASIAFSARRTWQGLVSTVVIHDVSEQKQAAENLTRLNRSLKAITECEQAIIRAADELTLLTDVCFIVCAAAGYRMAWMGLVEHDAEESVRPIAWGGSEDGYLANAGITWADTERGRGPTGTAARTGRTCFFQDFMLEPAAAPWRDAALARGYRSSIAIPLKDSEGTIFAVFTLYAAQPNAFTPDEVALLEQLVRDISFGVGGLRARAQRDVAEKILGSKDELLRMTGEIARVGGWEFDAVTGQGTWTEEVNAIHELEPGTATNVDFGLNFYSSESRPKIERAVRDAIEKALPYDLELEITTARGNRKWIRTIGVPVKEGGRVVKVRGVFQDITASKQAESELLDSERRFKIVATNTPDHILMQDADLRYTLVINPQLGLTEEEMLGRTDFDFLAKDDADKLTAVKRRVLVTGNPELVSTSLRAKDGSAQYFEGTYLPTHAADGKANGILGYFRNVTQRVQMEADLLHQRERFQILSEANSLLLTSEKPERMIETIATKVMEHLDCDVFFNFIRDNATGRLRLNAYNGIPIEAAADIQWLDVGTAICGCVARDGCRIISEDILHNNDVRADLVRSFGVQAYACHPLHIGDKTIGTLSFGTRSRQTFSEEDLDLMRTVADRVSAAIHRSRTEDTLRETGDYLNNLFNYANAPIIVWNPDFEITRFNRAFERLTGRTSAEVEGKKLDILFPQDSRDGSMQLISDATAGARWEAVEIPILHRDGSVRILLWNSATLFAGDTRTPVATIAQGQDITERKRTEQIKDEFIGMVSHELKTPITVIVGAIDTAMTRGVPRKEAVNLMEDAAASAEALAGIVDNLLELSRVQARRLVIKKEPVDIERCVRNVMDKLGNRSGKHTLMVQIPAELPLAAADPVRVERIVHNLVENAIKYSPRGGIITVFARQAGEHVVIGVQDQGNGIAPELQEKIFMPFERLEKGRVPGIGLGLNVCRRLVEAHHGRIWVESKPGQGSTFFFSLPVLKD